MFAGRRPSRSVRSYVLGVALLAIAGLAGVIAVGDDAGRAPDSGTTAACGPPVVATDLSSRPVVDGLDWVDLPPGERAPVPSASSSPAPPTNQWWSSALVGPGTEPLWARPLAVQIGRDGEVAISNQAPVHHEDGTSTTAFVAALTVPPSGSTGEMRVADWGAFHVSLAVEDASTSLGVDVVAGSPFVELAFGDRPVRLVVGGGEIDGGAELRAEPVGDRALAISVRGRSWVLAVDRDVDWVVTEQSVEARPVLALSPGELVRAVLGPVPLVDDVGAAEPVEAATIDPRSWTDQAVDLADRPLITTTERLSVDEVGAVEQRLVVERAGAGPSVWSLGPHQEATGQEVIGWVPDPAGTSAIIASDELVLRFDPVPIMWGASPLDVSDPGAADIASLIDDDIAGGPAPATGSYFGGKRVAYDAAVADIATAYALAGPRAAALGRAREAFERLATGRGPGLAWNAEWGAVVMTPAEFGAGDQLNDHHLQYGYWVAAAGVLAAADASWAEAHRQLVDLLIADYAGSDLVPCAPPGLADRRTWDPQAGHSWASGLAPFADGNNLESTGESLHAWWAAARWFVATGRPELAESFIARLTIEARVTGATWFPEATGSVSARPWYGIVWSAKTDLGTWFDPAPESALGIQLLPLGPVSLTRYPDATAIESAARRWSWCAEFGGGCASRWSNLLASDAVVAGVEPPDGPDPEPSVPSSALAWWQRLWDSSPRPGPGRCSPGAITRTAADGMILLLAVNVGPQPTTAQCRLPGGEVVSLRLDAGERYTGPITPSPG